MPEREHRQQGHGRQPPIRAVPSARGQAPGTVSLVAVAAPGDVVGVEVGAVAPGATVVAGAEAAGTPSGAAGTSVARSTPCG